MAKKDAGRKDAGKKASRKKDARAAKPSAPEKERARPAARSEARPEPRAEAAFSVVVPVVALAVRDDELVVATPAGRLPSVRLAAGESLPAAARRALAEAGLDPRTDVVPLATDLAGDLLAVSFVALLRPDDAAVDAGWSPATRPTEQAPLVQAAVERLASLLETTTLATALVPSTFTVGELRGVYRAVWGQAPDGRNFHRKLTGEPELLVATGERTSRSGGRPAMLYRAGSATRLNPALSRG